MSGNGSGLGLQAAVAERLDGLTSWKVRYWAPFLLGMMMMGDSWDTGIIGYVMPSLRHEWGLPTMQVGAMISAGFTGQFIGALSFGPLAERFGRIPVFNGAVLLMSLLSVACAVAREPGLFTWLRFLQGVGFGGALPVCVSYVNELAPTATRGRYFSLFQFMMVCGFSLCGLASAVVIPAFGWRAMFVIGAFPALFSPFVLLTLPESPRWLARLGRTAATSQALVKLGAAPLAADVGATVREEAPRIPVAALFERTIRWHMIATCALWFLTSLVSYAFSTWTPTLYVDVFHLKLKDSLNYAAMTGVVYMFTPLVFALILDRVGRRPPGIVIASATLLTLIVLIVLGRSNPALSVLLIAIGWTTSGGSFVLLWPYTAEVFPTRMRSTALGVCSAVARAGSVLTPLVVAGVLQATGSISLVFVALAVPTFIVLMLWLFTSKEMARRRLEDVEGALA